MSFVNTAALKRAIGRAHRVEVLTARSTLVICTSLQLQDKAGHVLFETMRERPAQIEDDVRWLDSKVYKARALLRFQALNNLRSFIKILGRGTHFDLLFHAQDPEIRPHTAPAGGHLVDSLYLRPYGRDEKPLPPVLLTFQAYAVQPLYNAKDFHSPLCIVWDDDYADTGADHRDVDWTERGREFIIR